MRDALAIRCAWQNGTTFSVSLTIDDYFNRISFEQLSQHYWIGPQAHRCALRRCFGVRSPPTLPEMFQYFFNLKKSYSFIVDAQPDLYTVRGQWSWKLQRRWEFESTQGGGGFLLGITAVAAFAFGNSKYVGYEALYQADRGGQQGYY